MSNPFTELDPEKLKASAREVVNNPLCKALVLSLAHKLETPESLRIWFVNQSGIKTDAAGLLTDEFLTRYLAALYAVMEEEAA